jgi:hypothetical protein
MRHKTEPRNRKFRATCGEAKEPHLSVDRPRRGARKEASHLRKRVGRGAIHISCSSARGENNFTLEFDDSISLAERVFGHALVRDEVPLGDALYLELHVLLVRGVYGSYFVLVTCNEL